MICGSTASICGICKRPARIVGWYHSGLIICPPIAQRLQNGINTLAEFRQSVLHFRRVVWIDRPPCIGYLPSGRARLMCNLKAGNSASLSPDNNAEFPATQCAPFVFPRVGAVPLLPVSRAQFNEHTACGGCGKLAIFS